MHRRTALRLSLLATFAPWWSSSPAQGFPARPIRLVVTFPTGGAPDILARLFAERAQLGQPVLVDNRPGAGGNIGADAVAKSSPDAPVSEVIAGVTVLLVRFLLVATKAAQIYVAEHTPEKPETPTVDTWATLRPCSMARIREIAYCCVDSAV